MVFRTSFKAIVPASRSRSYLIPRLDHVKFLTNSSPGYRSLATAAGKEEDEYEIDLISMKKTAKSANKKRKEFVDPNAFKGVSINASVSSVSSFTSFHKTASQPLTSTTITSSTTTTFSSTPDRSETADAVKTAEDENIHAAPAASSVSTLKSDVSHGKDSTSSSSSSSSAPPASPLVDVDLVALDKFVGKYSWQLEQFLKFVRKSYDNKITTWNQLTAEELKNCLQIFEDLNNKGKFFVYSEGFQGMIQNIRRILLTYKEVPYHLEYLTQKWEYDLEHKIFRFLPELKVLSGICDFRTTTGEEISEILNEELELSNINSETLDRENIPEYLTAGEVSALIQANRYSNLSEILESIPGYPIGIWYVIEGKIDFNVKERDFSEDDVHIFLDRDKYQELNLILASSLDLETFLADLHNRQKDYTRVFETAYDLACTGELTSKSFIAQKERILSVSKEGFFQMPFSDKSLNVYADIDLPVEYLIEYQGTTPYYNFDKKTVFENFENWKNKLGVYDDNEFINFKFFLNDFKKGFMWTDHETSYLDSLVFDYKLNQIFDRRVESKTAPIPEVVEKKYIQLPDNIDLHNYMAELSTLYSEMDCEDFADLSSHEILSGVKELFDETNDFQFAKLHSRLRELFAINNGETSILDTVFQSQLEFSKFEEKLAKQKQASESTLSTTPESDASKVYRQIPDGFVLEEFLPELNQLKKALNVELFSEIESSRILSKLMEMSSDANHYDATKRILFSKLYRNLSFLFNHNNQHTFVLDNIIQNSQVFAEFEIDRASQRIFDSLLPINEVNLEIQKLFNSSLPTLENIIKINNWEKFEDDHYKKVSKRDFDLALTSCLTKVGTKQRYEVPIYKDVISQLKHFNRKIHNFPFVLFLLIKQGRADGQIGNETIQQIIEKGKYDKNTYSSSAETSSEFKVEDPIKNEHDTFFEEAGTFVAPRNNSEKSNKFDMSEFKSNDNASKKVTTPKKGSAYHNSEELLSTLTKKSEGASLENAKFTSSKFDFPKLSEDILKGDKPEFEKLEGYLKEAKREKQLKKERKFREQAAFEWSKSMCNSSRSLESKNFFSPISSFGGDAGKPLPQVENDHQENFKYNADGARRSRKQYLLVTKDGKKVVSKENPLGSSHTPEDMFAILNKFPKDDLHKLIKTIHAYQRTNWELIGGGGEDNMLLFVRERSGKSSWILQTLKSILATTGGVFLALLGLNYWLEEQGKSSGATDTIGESPKAPALIVKPVESNAQSNIEVGIEVLGELPEEETIVSVPLEDKKHDTGSWKSWLWNV